MSEARDEGLDLKREPWKYPGAALAEPILLGVPGQGPFGYAQLLAKVGRRLGQACVRLDAGDLPLNYVLLTRNVAAVDVRRQVIAFGSNASPIVLQRKFANAAVSCIAPMRPGYVSNACLAASAHVSRPGYVPAAARHAVDGRLPVVVAWLDGEQLACLDETEPNYLPLVLDGSWHDIILSDTCEGLSAATLYNTKWGVLPDGVLPEGPLTSGQTALWQRLVRKLPELLDESEIFRDPDPRSWMLRLQADDDLRDRVSAHLHALAEPPALRGAVAAPPTYSQCSSDWAAVGNQGLLRVRGSSDNVRRGGQVVVCINPVDLQGPHPSSHAIVRPDSPPVGGKGLAVLVVLQSDDEVEPGTAAVDQVGRNALGIEVGERVVLEPVAVPANKVVNWVLGQPMFIACRVQSADLSTVEKPVCLVDALTLTLLGLQSGDHLVLQGRTNATGEVLQVRLRAHEAPVEVLERRVRLSGGTFEARFPSTRDSLAVYPDLPWIFLDSSTRAALGLEGKLATVRVRSSRRYQVLTEMRESLLIVLLALVGLASVIDDTAALTVVIAVVLILSGLAVLLRLRTRLSAPTLAP